MKHESVYMFDVDGVLCEIAKPISRDVTKLLARLLNEEAYVIINTGRGYDRIHGEVVEPLRGFVKSDNLLDHLFVSTEMGGEVTTFESGIANTVVGKHSLSPAQLEITSKIYSENENRITSMHKYHAKKSMFTLVKKHDADKQVFLEQKTYIVGKFMEAFQDDDTVTIATTVESIDVYKKTAGKYAGAEAAYEWLQRVTDLQHDNFICFGDSHNDYEMARFFAHKNVSVKFVYTGETDLQVDDMHAGVEVVKSTVPYTGGVVEYLTEHVLDGRRIRQN